MTAGPYEPPAREAMRNFGDDPWRITVTHLHPEFAGQDESIFSLSNGYIGLRGNHEEGSPLAYHGTFVNGFHESWRIEHAEHAFGFAEHGQTIINAPDVKTIRVYVDDERLNLTTAELLEVQRTLDMRAGVLNRHLLWRTATGKLVQIETRRMVSFTHRHMATIEMKITVLNGDADITINSLLINRQDLTVEKSGRRAPTDLVVDPRKSDELTHQVLRAGPTQHTDERSVVTYQAIDSGMVLGVGVEHTFESGDDHWRSWVETADNRVRHVFQGRAFEGSAVTLTKTAVYHSSATAALPEMLDRCVQTLEGVAAEASEERWRQQREYLDRFWEHSDVRVDTDLAGVQQAIRWNLFQVAQASARADGLGIPAKGLTGSGYSGHYFWDSEIYVLPFLTYTNPHWARNALRARERMLPQARIRATTLSEDGALFPWRTINGEEASAYYAAGTAAYHINADITYALARYVSVTGDLDYLLRGAGDIVIETARLWHSLGFWGNGQEGPQEFHIHGVTGPDEYTAVVNDNLFTNVMARFNLQYAVEFVRRIEADEPEAFYEMQRRLKVHPNEVRDWEVAARGMHIPFSTEMQVHPQDAHFLEKEVWDLASTPAENKPLLLHYHPLVIYRFQVLKQTDVVLALLLASDEFTREQKRRNFEYYDALTTGDSTLSAVVQSILAAEVGYQELAYRYFDHALHVDLADLHGNTTDGVHIASAGGVWMTLVQGFAGMRDTQGMLSFDPRLPERWRSLDFKLRYRDSLLSITLTADSIQFELIDGHESASVRVRGEVVSVIPGTVKEVPLNGQGPNLGELRGLSAGILPREVPGEDLGNHQVDPHVFTRPVPTFPPTAGAPHSPADGA